MKTLIIYGSQYGSTKRYAEHLSETTGKEKIFHLRGAIDYNKLGFKHRFMMSMFHKMVLKMPESQRTADAKAMLETYGQKVDFVDFTSLEKIVNILL